MLRAADTDTSSLSPSGDAAAPVRTVEGAQRVERFQRTYDPTWKAALGPKKSAEIISAAMEASRDTSDGTST